MSRSRRLRVEVVRHPWGSEILLDGALVDDALLTLLPRELCAGLDRRIRFTMHGVSQFTSSGIGVFMRVLSELKGDHDIEFADCPEVVVDQFQMLDFSRYGRIVSFYATYWCESCEEEKSRLIALSDLNIAADGAVEAPTYPCSCGEETVVDDPLDFVTEHMPER